MPPSVRGALPLFVTRTVCGVDIVETLTFANERLVGLTPATPRSPVPDSETDCAPMLVGMLRVDELAVPVVGEKTI